jgi:hypothetical protein
MARQAPRPVTTVDRLILSARALTRAHEELMLIDLRTCKGELRETIKSARVESSAALQQIESALPLATAQKSSTAA